MDGEPTRRTSHAAAVTGMLLATVLAGCLVEIPIEALPGAAVPFQLWITDSQAPLKSLELSVTKVFVGNDQLKLQNPKFDLLAHNGLTEGFLLASGQLSTTEPEAIQVFFESATADINGTRVDLGLPADVLVFSPQDALDDTGQALLLDINATQSLRFDGATLNFVPHVDGAFLAAITPTLGDANSDGAPVFRPEATMDYEQSYRVSTPADLVTSDDGALADAAANATSPAAGVVSTAVATKLPVVGTSVQEADPDVDVKGWFIHFADGLSEREKILAVESYGASLVFLFGTIHVGYAFARDDQAWAMSQSPDVTYVEADRPVEFLLQSSRTAIRQPLVADPLLGIKDPSGNPIDGRGVGLAVVDIGVDGTHPDLLHWSLAATGAPVLRVNYKVESLFTVDVPTTDNAAGHGTHVAGIAAGRGTLDPTQKGIAPGAAVYAFGVGEADTTLWTNQALDWIVQNHDKVDPPIRVVTNSWMTLATYDPNSAVVKLMNNLVAEGVVVVFAAGNRAGEGLRPTTSGECQVPTPGVICVAAYDDLDLGTRDGKLAAYSSRGSTMLPSTWPDISAPGSRIRSTAPLVGLTTAVALESYTTLQGTSMAAPHVAGVVALMIQARPGLTPAQAESIIEATAHKYADAGPYDSTGSHHGKGHGLIDAYAAVAAAKVG